MITPYHTIRVGRGAELRFRRPPARKPLVATAVWMRGHPTGWQDRWPESISSHYLQNKHQAGLNRCDATVGLQLPSGCYSNNWDVDKGRVSAHTSGYIREAGCVLLNP